MKKFLALIMVLVFCFSLTSTAFAANVEENANASMSTSEIVPRSAGVLIDGGTATGQANRTTRISLYVPEAQYGLHFWYAAGANPDAQFNVYVNYPDGRIATLELIRGDEVIHRSQDGDWGKPCPKGTYTFVFAPSGDNDSDMTGFVANIFENF